MVYMRSITICFIALLLLFVLASGLFAQSGPNYTPIDPESQAGIVAPSTQEEPAPPSPKLYTVPRKQVLIEAFTRLG
jgi:hypothetical protein